MTEHYSQRYCDSETINSIKKALLVNLKNYDNSLILYYLFEDSIIDEMIITGELPFSNIYEKIDRYSSSDYKEAENKRKLFLNEVDSWLRKIRYYNENDESFWK